MMLVHQMWSAAAVMLFVWRAAASLTATSGLCHDIICASCYFASTPLLVTGKRGKSVGREIFNLVYEQPDEINSVSYSDPTPLTKLVRGGEKQIEIMSNKLKNWKGMFTHIILIFIYLYFAFKKILISCVLICAFIMYF